MTALPPAKTIGKVVAASASAARRVLPGRTTLATAGGRDRADLDGPRAARSGAEGHGRRSPTWPSARTAASATAPRTGRPASGTLAPERAATLAGHTETSPRWRSARTDAVSDGEPRPRRAALARCRRRCSSRSRALRHVSDAKFSPDGRWIVTAGPEDRPALAARRRESTAALRVRRPDDAADQRGLRPDRPRRAHGEQGRHGQNLPLRVCAAWTMLGLAAPVDRWPSRLAPVPARARRRALSRGERLLVGVT